MTYNDLYKSSIERLKNAGINEAESDVRLLFFYILSIDRSKLFMKANEEARDGEIKRMEEALSLREKRIPLQHITGVQEFMGLEFNVTPDVLIPRFDTETLVEEAMLLINDGDKVLDVCTGSGCIIISLMKYKNCLKGFGSDISSKAIEVAKSNANKLCKPSTEMCACGMDELMGITSLELCKPKFIESDLFDNINEKEFDAIISNPPYIKSEVISSLETEVKEHDPMMALDGGFDGLDFYRKIVSNAPSYLRKGGHLLVEIGYDQGEDVMNLFLENGFKDVAVVKDLAGNDRVVKGRK